MVEVKSVKVDNWGVFFLQKLQNFFNKTDYCDLTLQFKDNSQLKVHRLVLSACTDFFNVLEARYNVVDDTLVMPKDLQADVVVPIVNFMYTGTLEFEVNMYARLLKTAKDMNMTVLLKLLEAHKRTVGDSIRNMQSNTPVVLNKAVNQRMNTYSRPTAVASSSIPPVGVQRTYTSRRPAQVTKIISPRAGTAVPIKTEKIERTIEMRGSTIVRSLPASSYMRKNLPEPVQLVAKYANSPAAAKGPSRFECTDDSTPEAFESSFDNISYESKPLITASQLSKDDNRDEGSSISFEKLKRSATGAAKRSFSGSPLVSPPEKKPNIQEVKEYTEARRVREKIVAEEFEDDPDCFGDDFQNNDDDDDDEAPEATSSGSVVIKGDSSSPVSHAKIISEVLKKYPHLVKNNKNIKLKIMQKGNQQVKVSTVQTEPAVKSQPKPTIATMKTTTRAQQAAAAAAAAASTATVTKKVVSVAQSSIGKEVSAPATTPAPQPKKIDSRTMHALIAKGAENMTGPWLCLECGVNGRPISIPSYRGFRRHLIAVHKANIDKRLCEHCGWRSIKRNDLHYHMLTKHSIKAPADLHFPKCALCDFVAIDLQALRKHKQEDHQAQSSQQVCIYCNKTFSKEIYLYAHMRDNHKERAQEDGVMDFSEDELYEDDADKYVPNHPEASTSTANTSGSADNKIKILSNIALPSKSPFVLDAVANASNIIATAADNISLEPSSEAEGLSNVASGIATSLAVLDTNVHMDEGDGAYHDHDETDDLQSSQYIEAAMANVHGEILSEKKEDENGSGDLQTKFITEEGSELELTAAQKAELLEQLQGQSDGLTDNVVMVLNDAAFEQEHAAEGEQEEQHHSESEEGGVVLVSAQTSTKKSEADESITDTDTKNDESMDLGDEDHDVSADNASADDESVADASTTAAAFDADVDPKESKSSEKGATNLISALEGDWTDDEDDEPTNQKKTASSKVSSSTTATEKPATRSSKQAAPVQAKSVAKKPTKIVDDSYDSSSSGSSATSSKKPKSTGDAEKSGVTNLILDDWDSQQSDKNESELEKSADKSIDDIEEEPIAAEEDASNGIKKEKSQNKSDLKTLINDWGDEDDDTF